MKKLLLILLCVPLIGLSQFPRTATVTDSINYQYLIDSAICIGTWHVIHVDDLEYGERDDVYNLDYYIEIYEENEKGYSTPEIFLVTIRRRSGICTSGSFDYDLINSPVYRLIPIREEEYGLLDDWGVTSILNINRETKNIDTSNNLFHYGYGKETYMLIPQETKLDALQKYVNYED